MKSNVYADKPRVKGKKLSAVSTRFTHIYANGFMENFNKRARTCRAGHLYPTPHITLYVPYISVFQNYFLREFWDTLYIYIYIHSKLVEPRGQHYHKALTCQRYWLYESGVVDEMEETGPHVKEKDFSRRRGGGVAVEEGRGRKTHPSAVFRADPRHPISRHKCRGRGVFREME